MMLKNVDDFTDNTRFRGAQIVFIVPDERIIEFQRVFQDKGIKNDVFGVREAKGLEFDSCLLLGFFSYFEQQSKSSSTAEWKNVLRWLFSTKGLSKTESTEEILGKRLENCNYQLSHPEIQDQASML